LEKRRAFLIHVCTDINARYYDAELSKLNA